MIAVGEEFPCKIKTEAVPYLGTAFFMAIVSYFLISSQSSLEGTPVLPGKYWSTL